MKNLTILILALLLIQITAIAQPCLPEGITFTTQAQIDNFQTNYPNCTEIEGDVEIGTYPSGDISNLNGLSVLTFIEGMLYIGYNDSLISITGLQNLTSIGSLYIRGNKSLSSLSGLDAVTSIGGMYV